MCRPPTRKMTTTSHTDKTRFLPLALGRSRWHFRYSLFPPVIALPVKQISTTTTTTSSTSWTLPTTTTTTLPYVWSLTKTSKKRRVSKLWNYRQLMAPCSLIPKIITHLTAQLNWKLPISLLILDDFFFYLRNTFFLGEPNFANDGGFIHMFWNHFQPEKLGVQMIHLTPIWRLANRRICFSPNWVGWNSTTKNLLICYESIPQGAEPENKPTEVLQSPYLKLGLLADGGRPTRWEETTCFFFRWCFLMTRAHC